MKFSRLVLFFFIMISTAVFGSATAATRHLLYHQGLAQDLEGNPVSGVLNVTFRLYADESSNAALWEETQAVSFDEGFFSAELGRQETIAEEAFDEDSLFLGMQIEGDNELSPRQAFFSIPWAEQCEVAMTAKSLANDVVTSESIAPRAVTSAAIAASAVGPAELAFSGVTAGTYTLATITVDEDGRITSASSGSPSGGEITGLSASNISTGTLVDARLSSNVSLLGSSIESMEIADGTIANTDIHAAAAIGWTKISKTGALPGDVGAAAAIHTHAASDVTGTLADVQISDSLTIGASSSVSDAALSSNVTKLGQTIESSEITDGTIASADLAASVAGGGLIGGAGTDLSVGAGDGILVNPDTISVDVATTGTTSTTASNSGLETTSGGVRVLGGCSNGQVLKWNTTTSQWECNSDLSGAEDAMPHVVLVRRFGYAVPLATNSTALTGVGMPNPTASGTATAQPALSDRMFVRYASAVASGSVAGIIGAANLTRPSYRPKLSALVRTDTTIDSRRIWTGVSEASLAALPASLGTAASTNDFAAIVYDTGVSSNWLCCSGDGTNYSCSDTGIAVAPSTDYILLVDWSSASQLLCSVNGTSIVKTTNLSASAINIGPYSAATTLTAASRNHFIAKIALEQN